MGVGMQPSTGACSTYKGPCTQRVQTLLLPATVAIEPAVVFGYGWGGPLESQADIFHSFPSTSPPLEHYQVASAATLSCCLYKILKASVPAGT